MDHLKYYFTIIVIALLISSKQLFAQSANSPFEGSIYIGSGASTIINFNGVGDGEKLSIHAGLCVNKWLGKTHFMQVGINYASRGALRTEFIRYRPSGGTIYFEYSVYIHSIDISLMLYSKSKFKESSNILFFYGIRNSYLPVSPIINDGAHFAPLDDQVFRKYNLALCSGIGVGISKNIRLDLALNCHVLSLIKPEYRYEFNDVVETFNARIYPLEIILSMNYYFK